MSLLTAWSWTLEIPSNPIHSIILWCDGTWIEDSLLHPHSFNLLQPALVSEMFLELHRTFRALPWCTFSSCNWCSRFALTQVATCEELLIFPWNNKAMLQWDQAQTSPQNYGDQSGLQGNKQNLQWFWIQLCHILIGCVRAEWSWFLWCKESQLLIREDL